MSYYGCKETSLEGGIGKKRVRGNLVLTVSDEENVTSVCGTSDGKYVAVGTHQKVVYLWDSSKQKIRETIRGGKIVQFSQDNQLMGVIYMEKYVRISFIATMQEFRKFKVDSGPIQCIGFSRDSEYIAAGSGYLYVNNPGVVYLFNIYRGVRVLRLSGHDRGISSLSMDRLFIVTGSYDSSIRIWNTQKSCCVKALTGNSHCVTSVCLSRDYGFIVSGSLDFTVKIWNFQGELLQTLREHTDIVTAVLFLNSHKDVASSSADHTIKLCNLELPRLISTLRSHSNWVTAVTFSPNDKYVASCSFDQTICLWSVHTKELIVSLKAHRGWVTCLAFSPDSLLLASGSTDQAIMIWTTEEIGLPGILKGHIGQISSICFSLDGHLLASGGHDTIIRIWNTHTQQIVHELKEHENWIECLHFTTQLFISSCYNEKIVLRKAETYEIVASFPGGKIFSISTDAKLISFPTHSYSIRLFPIVPSIPQTTLKGHTAKITSLQFSPNAPTLVSSSLDNTLRIWCTLTSSELHRLIPHSSAISSIAISQGSLVVSGSYDYTVKLHLIPGPPCSETIQPSSPVSALCYIPTLKTLISGHSNSFVKR